MGCDIAEVVETLRGIPAEDFVPGSVCRRLRGTDILLDSLSPYLHHAPTGYTRNLIHRDEVFELLALCWAPGSASHIHNHSGQLCWLSIQQGNLRLENFHSFDGAGPGTGIRLERCGGIGRAETGCLDLQRGEDGIHRVSNPFEVAAVSLHVYSRPFDHCIAYDLEKGTAAEIPLAYHSVGGRLCARSPG